MIVKTPAIVLRAIKFGDTSRIVTLFTRDAGKVAVVAKGARAKGNRFGSALQPGSLILAVYYDREGRDVQTLTQADLAHRHRRIGSSLEATAAMLQMVEVLYAFTHANDAHPEVFDLAADGLAALDEGDDGIPQILLWYRWGIAARLGFQPTLETCIRCGRSIDVQEGGAVRFHIVRGGPLCGTCEEEILPMRRRHGEEYWTDHQMDAASLVALRRITGLAPVAARAVALSDRARNQLENTTRLYERYHFDRSQPLRTSSLVRDVLRSGGS